MEREREERGRVGDVVRSSRRELNKRRLGEYIAIVESFGYTVTKNEKKPEPEKEPVKAIPADGLPSEKDDKTSSVVQGVLDTVKKGTRKTVKKS